MRMIVSPHATSKRSRRRCRNHSAGSSSSSMSSVPKYRRKFALLLCYSFLQYGAIETLATTSWQGPSTRQSPFTTFVLRGGAPQRDNNDQSHQQDTSANEEEEERPEKPFWSSLFQLGNDVKSDAAGDDQGGALVVLAQESSTTATTNQGGRGGAMVKEAKPRRFQWFTMYAERASSTSAEKEQEASDEQPTKEIVDQVATKPTLTHNKQEDAPSIISKETFTRPDEVTADEKQQTKDNIEPKDTWHHLSEHDKDRILAEKSNETIDVIHEISVEADKILAKGYGMPESSNGSDGGVGPAVGDGSESPHTSSGYWETIDKALTFGYASSHPGWRVSRKLRPIRKASAKITGLHGLLSGKVEEAEEDGDDDRMGAIRRRLAAIARARENVEQHEASKPPTRRGFWWQKERQPEEDFNFIIKKSSEEIEDEKRRKERVKEIDRLISESQLRLSELACEKDMLQRSPNPLWNYTTVDSLPGEATLVSAKRRFNFPPQDLVDEYLDMVFSSGRIIRLNHTDLWRGNGGMDEEDDDDELELSSDSDSNGHKRKNGNNGSSGSWLLRNGLGEKIGEAAEIAAYKAVCAAVMGALARSLSALHGVNVMQYSDIRLFMEQAPNLPPLAAGIIPGSGKNENYAQGALEQVLRRGTNKRRKRYRPTNDDFIQHDAVVETLLSLCQISAPLLKLFPLAWQRAMIGNIVTLITSLIADFFEGVEFSILGHRLTFSFTPISEADMLRNLGNKIGEGFNRHRARPEEFEAAVKATADGLADELKFLDRWHERALGSGILRTQIANLIARLVLTLVDDVLSGAKMDLWAAHAGGPRLVAGLEYRTTQNYMDMDKEDASSDS